jgi:hypothetical protein
MERGWKYRRIMVYIIVITCLVILMMGLYIGGDSPVVQSVIQSALVCLMTTAGGYLGFSTYDDKVKGQELIQMKEKGVE